METSLGAMTTAGGLFLFLWYRTVVTLPVKQQPLFIHPASFKWGIPILCAILLALGLCLLAAVNPWRAALGAGVTVLLAFLVLIFDRYSAGIRVIYERYRSIRSSNPNIEDAEALYHTARWRYPNWAHDRVVELIAGKDIHGLILLMIISENEVNPIADWELYRTIKKKVYRLGRPPK